MSKADQYVTRLELAKALGVNPQTLVKWTEEGMPVAERGHRGKASLYDVEACRTWKEAREKGGLGGSMAQVALARARKEHAQATLAEQLAAARARESLPVADVEKVWSAERDAIRTAILTLPTQAPRVMRVATLEGEAGVERILKEIAHETLRELAAGKHLKADSPQRKRQEGAA